MAWHSPYWPGKEREHSGKRHHISGAGTFLKIVVEVLRLQDQRASAEILLIVVGVSIALAADSWLADRAEEGRTNLLLDSLVVEWAAELERMNAYVEDIDQAMAGVVLTISAH
jgi:hypothetical protein